MVKVPQHINNLSPAVKELERMILDKKIVHDGNPIMSWMVGNVVPYDGRNGNRSLSKKYSKEKIDGFAALVTALARAIVSEQSESVYDLEQSERLLFL
jgi:phage terminase large subunit-like protein